MENGRTGLHSPAEILISIIRATNEPLGHAFFGWEIVDGFDLADSLHSNRRTCSFYSAD